MLKLKFKARLTKKQFLYNTLVQVKFVCDTKFLVQLLRDIKIQVQISEKSNLSAI